jgi:hypothetical protein
MTYEDERRSRIMSCDIIMLYDHIKALLISKLIS